MVNDPDKLFEQANELLINDDFDEAVKLYTTALELYGKEDAAKCANCYLGRSQAYLKLNKTHDALNDAQTAIDLNKTDSRGYLRKGMAMFKLKNYVDALGTLEKGQTLLESDGGNKNLFADWIAKCNAEIAKNAPVPQAAFKHEWYQTESHVVVSIMAKNFTAKDVTISNTDRDLNVEATNPDLKLKFNFHFFLPIRKDETQIKYLANKIEIKLKKTEAVQWPKLEGKPNEVVNAPLPMFNVPPAAPVDHKPSYPSSSKHAKNWDKVEVEINKEDKEGNLDNDDALNKLLKQVYGNGSEETRKAMNKSFVESGGTVLSTNWKDIGKGKVDMKPPDGMEFKKWDQ